MSLPTQLIGIKASLPARIAAHLIDLLVGLGLCLGLNVLLRPLLGDSMVILLSIYVLFLILYFTIFEGWVSTTPGKRLLGIYVLRTDLKGLGPREALIRNLFRVADLSLLYVPVLTRDRRRLGDGAAGTIVVSESSLIAKLPEPESFKRIVAAPEEVFPERRALMIAFLDQLEEELPNIGEGEVERMAESLARRRGMSVADLRAYSLKTLGLEEDRQALAIVAMGFLDGLVAFKPEESAERALAIYQKASEFAFDPWTRERLGIKARALQAIIDLRKGKRGRVEWGKVREIYAKRLPSQFRRNFPYFILSAGMFLIPAILGYYYMRGLADVMRKLLAPDLPPISEMGAGTLFLIIAFNNLRVLLLTFGGGGSPFVIPLLLTANGIVLGSFGGSFAGQGRFILFLSGIFPHGLLELSAIFLSASAGLRAIRALLFPPGDLSRYEAIRASVDESLELGVASAVFLFPAALIESFLTEKLMSRPKVALLAGVIPAIALYLYLGLAGRRETYEEEGEKGNRE